MSKDDHPPKPVGDKGSRQSKPSLSLYDKKIRQGEDFTGRAKQYLRKFWNPYHHREPRDKQNTIEFPTDEWSDGQRLDDRIGDPQGYRMVQTSQLAWEHPEKNIC